MNYRIRTVQILPGHPLYPFCTRVCSAANNLYNAALFVERQVFTGAGKDDKDLEELQRSVLKSIEASLEGMNATVKKPKADPKYQMPSSERSFLNYEFLRAYMRVTQNPDYMCDALKINTANNVLREVVHACFDFIKANKAYAKNPASFTSKPQLPGYLPKQGLHTVSIPNDDCVLTTMDKLWRSKREGAQTATINSPWEDFISLEHKNKVVYFSGSGLCCDVGQTYGHRIAEVKIEPFHNAFFIRVHLIPEEEKHDTDALKAIKEREKAEIAALADLCNETPLRACCIDLGVENFAAIVNNVGAACILIKGGVIKAKNQYFNKNMALLRSRQAKEENAKRTNASAKDTANQAGEPNATEENKASDRIPAEGEGLIVTEIDHLSLRRENQIDYLFHKIADVIIRWCKKNDIHVIVIGWNKGWKQKAAMGPVNNQNFVAIPFRKFIYKLRYRAEKAHIYLLEQDESYTSLASFLDQDPIPTYKKGDSTVYSFSGVRGPTTNAAGREKPPSANGKGSSGYRGLYRSSNGTIINADLNASANIGRKALPRMFTDGQMPDFNKVIVIKRPDDANKLLGLET